MSQSDRTLLADPSVEPAPGSLPAQLHQHLRELERTIRQQREQLDEARTRYAALAREREQLLRLVARQQAALADHDTHEHLARTLKAERDRLRALVETLRHDNEALASSAAQLEDELAEERQRRGQAERELAAAADLIDDLEALAAQLEHHFDEMAVRDS